MNVSESSGAYRAFLAGIDSDSRGRSKDGNCGEFHSHGGRTWSGGRSLAVESRRVVEVNVPWHPRHVFRSSFQSCLFIPHSSSSSGTISTWKEEGNLAAGEISPPLSTPAPESPRRKKMLVLVLVAVLIVAAFAAVAYVLLSQPQPPTLTLDRVEVSPRSPSSSRARRST